MPLNKTISIPKPMQTGFAQLFALDDTDFLRLVEALTTAQPKLDGNKFASAIAAKAQIQRQDITELLRVLVSLYLGRISGHVSIAEFVDLVCATLAEKPDDWAKPQDGNWQPFKDRLSQLLALDNSVGITAKALSIVSEHDHVFLTGQCRVLTDIRPVFTDDISTSPNAAVIIHTLKIGYAKGDDACQFFVALDSQDLRELLEVLKRAELKEKSLLLTLDAAHIQHLSPMED